MSDDPYVYPGTSVLKNRFGITDAQLLDYHEREITKQRMSEGVPDGEFDLKHLQTIHKHLFQDIYDWAGEIRTVEISKEQSQFQFRQYIETGMADVHKRIKQAGHFLGSSRGEFAKEAGKIMGDVNYVHPFREGNGRTQLAYLKALSVAAGHKLDLGKIEREAWKEASRKAHNADYLEMTNCIEKALDKERYRFRMTRTDHDKEREIDR